MADKKDDVIVDIGDDFLSDIPVNTKQDIPYDESFKIFEQEQVSEEEKILSKNFLEIIRTPHGNDYVDRYIQLKEISNNEKSSAKRNKILHSSKEEAEALFTSNVNLLGNVKSIVEEKELEKKADLLAKHINSSNNKKQIFEYIATYNKRENPNIPDQVVNTKELNTILEEASHLKSEAHRLNISIKAYYDNGQKEKAVDLAIQMGLSPERHKHEFTDKALVDAYNKGFSEREKISKENIKNGILNQYTLTYNQNLNYKNLRDKFSGLKEFSNMATRYITVSMYLQERDNKTPSFYEASELANYDKYDDIFRDRQDFLDRVIEKVNSAEGKTRDEKLFLTLSSLYEDGLSNLITIKFAQTFKELKLNLPLVDQEMFLMKDKLKKINDVEYKSVNFYRLETPTDKNSIDAQIKKFTKNKLSYNTDVKISETGKSYFVAPNETNKLKNPVVFLYSEDMIKKVNFYREVAAKLKLEDTSNISPLKEGITEHTPFIKKAITTEINGRVVKLYKIPKGYNGGDEKAYYEYVKDEEAIKNFVDNKENKLENDKIIQALVEQKPELKEEILKVDNAIIENNEKSNTPKIGDLNITTTEHSIGDLDSIIKEEPVKKVEPVENKIEFKDEDFNKIQEYLRNFMIVNAMMDELNKKFEEEKKNLFEKTKNFEDKLLIEKALRDKYYGLDQDFVAEYAEQRLQNFSKNTNDQGVGIHEFITDKYLNQGKLTIEMLKTEYPYLADIEKRVIGDIEKNFDKTSHNINDALHKATVKTFASEFKIDEKDTQELFSKERMLKVATTALKGTSLLINPVGFAIGQTIKGLMKTEHFQSFKQKLSDRANIGLNSLGITEGTATRKYFKIAAGVSAAVGIGAYLVISNDLTMEDLIKLKNNIAGIDYEGAYASVANLRSELIDKAVNVFDNTELTQIEANKLNAEVVQASTPITHTAPTPTVNEFTTSIENALQPATSREISSEIMKSVSTPQLEEQITKAGLRMGDLELAINQNINEQMLSGRFPTDMKIEILDQNNKMIVVDVSSETLQGTRASLEQGLAKVEVITNSGVIAETPNILKQVPPISPDLVGAKEILPATPDQVANALQGQTYNDIPLIETAKPEDIAKALETTPAQVDTVVEKAPVIIEPTTLEVQKGDSLYKIASNHLGENATPEKINDLIAAISQENGIKNPNLIHIGDKITIPDIGNLQPVELRVAFNDPTDLYSNNLYLPPNGVDTLAEQMASVYVNDNISPENKELLVDKLKEIITYHSDGQAYANLSNSSFRYDVKEVVFELARAQEQLIALEAAMEEQLEHKAFQVKGTQI